MKNIFYLGSVMCLMALSFMGCTQEENFRIPTSSVKNLNFNVTNLSVGSIDQAQSTVYDYSFSPYYDDEGKEKEFTIDFKDISNGNLSQESYSNTVTIPYSNVVWSGGMNELELTFTPSCPEEKEATFTMPDGKVYTVTADKPTFTWEVTPEARFDDTYSWDKYMIITAESSYQKQGDTVYGKGYVMISFNYEGQNLQYNKDNKTWYYNDWRNNPEISIKENVSFTATNMTVGLHDYANSVIYNNYYDSYQGEPRDDKFVISYLTDNAGNGIQTEENTVYLNRSGSLWAGCNNEIELSFTPSCPEEKEATFTMPDGKEVTLTADNPSFTWEITPECANSFYSYQEMVISAKSSYTRQGLSIAARGYVMIYFGYMGTELQYNKANDTWYYNDWRNNNEIKLKGNVNFSVVNTTVGDSDYANSAIYEGYFGFTGYRNRYDTISFDVVYGSSDAPSSYRFMDSLDYENTLWAAGNNELKVTYIPSSADETGATFTFPDGTTFNATPANPSYVWTLNKSTVGEGYDYGALVIQAENNYQADGISYQNHGYVMVNVNTYIQYDPVQKIWRDTNGWTR